VDASTTGDGWGRHVRWLGAQASCLLLGHAR